MVLIGNNGIITGTPNVIICNYYVIITLFFYTILPFVIMT